MPTISVFFGITIRMYYDDHAPPHFHVYYGEHGATIEIESLRLLAGPASAASDGLVLEWAAEHRDELRVNWARAEGHEVLSPIQPLD